jgi:hypothetical protein
MNLARFAAFGVALAGLALAGPAEAQDRSGWPQSLKVGTASQGGTYFIYGAGWAGLVQEMLGVNTSTEATGGPVQNMALVHNGDLDFAMTTMGPAYDAWTGQSPLAPGVEMKDVRATFPMYQTPFHIVTLQSSGIDSVEELAGKKVGLGPRGGTPGTVFPKIFADVGIEIDPQYGGASDLAGQLQDGLIDAFAFAAGLPIAAFSQVEAQAPVNFFSFTDEQLQTILEANPALSAYTIPGDTYRSMGDDQETVAMWNFGIVHKDMPEDLVYEVMKTVLDNPDRMAAIHSAAAETVPEAYDKNNFLWFHPGAIRYYREKGLELGENVIPPEAKN